MGTPSVRASVLPILRLQEPGAEKTNNGIHYRLRLVYNNGERVLPLPQEVWVPAPCVTRAVPFLGAEEGLAPGGRGWSVAESLEVTASPLRLPTLGLRTEQDLYVRLIDSMSKQVSQPRACSRPPYHPLGTPSE